MQTEPYPGHTGQFSQNWRMQWAPGRSFPPFFSLGTEPEASPTWAECSTANTAAAIFHLLFGFFEPESCCVGWAVLVILLTHVPGYRDSSNVLLTTPDFLHSLHPTHHCTFHWLRC